MTASVEDDDEPFSSSSFFGANTADSKGKGWPSLLTDFFPPPPFSTSVMCLDILSTRKRRRAEGELVLVPPPVFFTRHLAKCHWAMAKKGGGGGDRERKEKGIRKLV